MVVNDSHRAVLTDYHKRLKVQEQINSLANMARQIQDMVEVQNQLGPRDLKEAALTIMGEFTVLRTVIRHMTDVMLDGKQLAFIKLLNNNYKNQLGQFDVFVSNTVQSAANQLILFITPLQSFYWKNTTSPRGGVVPAPLDFLDTRLQASVARLLQVEQRGASLANPLPRATMSMNNLATTSMGNLFPLSPSVGFSNAGGTKHFGAITADVSIDEFNQLLA